MLQMIDMHDFDMLHGFPYDLQPLVQREVEKPRICGPKP